MKMKKNTIDKIIFELMIAFFIFVISSIAFFGFFSKWSFRDSESSRFGITAMIEGTADRPFVYRRLLPETAKAIVNKMSNDSKEGLEKKLLNLKLADQLYVRATTPKNYSIEYYIMMIMCYGFLIGAVLNIYRLLMEIGFNSIVSLITTSVFTLILPFFETIGGYYYDFPEIFFFALVTRYALKGNFTGLVIMTPFATANKEAFFFFLPTLLPLLVKKATRMKSICCILLCMFLSGCTYLCIKQNYISNSGEMMEYHLLEHLEELFEIQTYFYLDINYGMLFGGGMFLLHIIFVIWIAYYSWNLLCEKLRWHVKFAAVINGSLYLLFATPGEIRNLSLLYISFIFLLANYIEDKTYSNKKE